jgi:MurNAc alpha-1-phosphate uridylyltransferase
VERVVVTLHRDAEAIRRHLAGRQRPSLLFREERPLLETGGGVKAALSLIDGRPFFVVDTDVMWLNGPRPALTRLREVWDDAAMDALVLVTPTVTARGKDGPGDFFLDPEGRLTERPVDGIAPYYFAGVQLLHPRLFDGAPGGPFPINDLWRKAEAAGRLWGVVHDGAWFHIGTPEGLREVEAELATKHLRWIEP